jgi:hypothetical protein
MLDHSLREDRKAATSIKPSGQVPGGHTLSQLLQESWEERMTASESERTVPRVSQLVCEAEALSAAVQCNPVEDRCRIRKTVKFRSHEYRAPVSWVVSNTCPSNSYRRNGDIEVLETT